MATAAELLAKIGETDDTLVIDNYLRTINIPSSIKNLGVEFDDDVLRLNFKMPRYLDDTDLSAFTIRVNYMNANGDGDVYTVSDKFVDSEYITFSWLVGPTATAYKGITRFNVCMIVVGEGGYVEKEYNTAIASLPVLEGLEVDDRVVTEYSDIFEQWRKELFEEPGTVRYTSQDRTDEEKKIARANIGANVLCVAVTAYTNGTAESGTDFAAIKKAYDDGRVIVCKQGTVLMPMAGISGSAASFSTIHKGVSHYCKIQKKSRINEESGDVEYYTETTYTATKLLPLYVDVNDIGAGEGKTTFSAIKTAIDGGHAVYILRGEHILSAVSVNDNKATFQMYEGSTYEWVQVKSDNTIMVVTGTAASATDLQSLRSEMSSLENSLSDDIDKIGSSLKPPLYVTVEDHISADRLVTYSADKTFGEIATAYANGRVVLCKFANKLFLLDTVQSGNAAAFSTLYKETHHRVTIYNSGTVKYEAFKITLESNDEKYFDMDANGIISLKPEYRGASTSDSEDMEYSVSDNGYGLPGSKNCDLPEALVIPETIGGYRVAGYEVGMFYKNSRLKKLTLLSSVTEIPKGFCSNCINLRQIVGTDRVTYIGEQAFAYTAITEVRFPRLTGLDTLKGKQFMCCAHLTTADLGTKTTKITKIPDKCFYACEYLASLEGCDNVTELGVNALYHTKNLKELPFRDKLTTIGTDALYLSRANKDNAESFISSSIVPKYTGKKHYNRIRSTFEQHNPLWANKYIINHQDGEVSLKRKYNAACMYMSAFVVYSAFKKRTMFSPEDFANEIFEAHPELAKQDAGGAGTWSVLKNLVKTMMGYEGTLYESVTTDSIQAVYDALLEGALVITRIPGDNTRVNGVLDVENHIVVIYGINEDGEVMVVDSSTVASRAIGVYEASTYTMPIQNMCRPDDIFMIVPAPPTST